MPSEKMSPAVQLLTILWRNSQQETGRSWLRLNSGMRDGLFLAVRIGLRFDLSDLKLMLNNFCMGRWIGAGGFEIFYREAVLFRNASAWKCFEDFLPRKPFIWPATYTGTSGGYGPVGGGLARLVIGARFSWDQRTVTVTSIDSDSVIACAYKMVGPENQLREKIDKRYRITREMFSAQRKKISDPVQKGAQQ